MGDGCGCGSRERMKMHFLDADAGLYVYRGALTGVTSYPVYEE